MTQVWQCIPPEQFRAILAQKDGGHKSGLFLVGFLLLFVGVFCLVRGFLFCFGVFCGFFWLFYPPQIPGFSVIDMVYMDAAPGEESRPHRYPTQRKHALLLPIGEQKNTGGTFSSRVFLLKAFYSSNIPLLKEKGVWSGCLGAPHGHPGFKATTTGDIPFFPHPPQVLLGCSCPLFTHCWADALTFFSPHYEYRRSGLGCVFVYSWLMFGHNEGVQCLSWLHCQWQLAFGWA